MASNRHLSRIAALQAIFSYEFRDSKFTPDIPELLSSLSSKPQDSSYAKELFEGINSKKEEILNAIAIEAPEWPVSRIAPVDRAILQIGAYEIMFSDNVPPVVAIDEAVEIAKKFGDNNSSKFINGVLSSIMHKYKPNTNLNHAKREISKAGKSD